MDRPPIFILAVFLVSVHQVDADVITQWTFESSQPSLSDSATISGITAEVGIGVASGTHASANTDWSNPAGDGSSESLSSNNWSLFDRYLFQTSTQGFTDIEVSFATQRSDTGPTAFSVFYSFDGAIFLSLAENQAIGTSFSTFGPLAIPGAANQTDVYVSIAASTAPTSFAGTFRLDNVTFLGNTAAVPEPSFWGLLAIGALGFCCHRRLTFN